MSEANYSIDLDLVEAQALADHLVPYVYEPELYGSISGMFGSSSMPSLTIGALQMRLHRLRVLEDQMTGAQKAILTDIEARNEQVRQEWMVHYDDKMVLEGRSRLKVIQAFFADCEDDPRSCANNYMPEALRRTIVEDILKAFKSYHVPSAELAEVARLNDTKLRRFTQPSDFIWASALQPAYPRDEYWWLYALPPRSV
jgi:hypothetical protein